VTAAAASLAANRTDMRRSETATSSMKQTRAVLCQVRERVEASEEVGMKQRLLGRAEKIFGMPFVNLNRKAHPPPHQSR
jgi:hypothetical protein